MLGWPGRRRGARCAHEQVHQAPPTDGEALLFEHAFKQAQGHARPLAVPAQVLFRPCFEQYAQ